MSYLTPPVDEIRRAIGLGAYPQLPSAFVLAGGDVAVAANTDTTVILDGIAADIGDSPRDNPGVYAGAVLLFMAGCLIQMGATAGRAVVWIAGSPPWCQDIPANSFATAIITDMGTIGKGNHLDPSFFIRSTQACTVKALDPIKGFGATWMEYMTLWR